MVNRKFKSIVIAMAAIFIILAGTIAVALHFASNALKDQIQQALGTDSEVREIAMGWSNVELRGVRIHAPSGWPSENTLSAERIVVTPNLKSLLSSTIVISEISITSPYISLLRTQEGRLRLLPSLLESKSKSVEGGSGSNNSTQVNIEDLEIRDGIVEFFDASIKRPPHKIRMEQLNATVSNVHVPNIAGHTAIRLEGKIKGVRRDGELNIDGWIDIIEKNSAVTTKLRGVDLISLQAYLIKTTETGVKKGALDLDLKSNVHENRLNAAGTVTLTGLELAPGNGAFATFMGVPRNAVIASMKNRNDQIVVPFTLNGNLSDPHFSLNESLTAHIGSSVAETLGVSIAGLAHGVGNAAQGVEGAVKKLLGK